MSTTTTKKGRKASVDETKEKEVCKVCGEHETKDAKIVEDKWVQCEVCEEWSHIQCVGVEEKEFDMLSKAIKKGGKQIHWFCQSCNTSTLDMLKVMKEIKAKNELLEHGLNETKKDVERGLAEVRKDVDKGLAEGRKEVSKGLTEVRKEVAIVAKHLQEFKAEVYAELKAAEKKMEGIKPDLIEKKIQESMKNVQETEWRDVVAKQVEGQLQKVTSNISAVKETLSKVKQSADEQKDRESRAANIIIYNVAESTSASNEDRISDDYNFCLETFNKVLGVKIVPSDVKRAIRLGKRNADLTLANNIRPLLLQMRDRVLKNMIMESLSKLKEADEEHKKLIFAHDLTKLEREECKRMVAEAREQELHDTSGEFSYRVRGSPGSYRIVKIRKQN